MDVTLSQYRTYYKSLALKMACAIVIVAVVPLIIMAAFSRHFFVGSYKEKVLDHLTALVRTQQQQIGEFLTERLDALRLIGLTTRFDQLSDETTLQDRWAALQMIYGKSLLGLTLCDQQGGKISSVGAIGLKPGDELRSDTLAKVLELRSYVGETYHGASGSQYFVLAVSVEQSVEKRILLAAVGVEPLNMLLEDLRSAQPGNAAILNRSGARIAPGPSGSHVSTAECVATPWPGASPDRDVSVGETPDGSGLCIKTNLKHSDWVLEFVVPTHEAYRAFWQPRMLALATLLLGVVSIVALAIVVSKRFSKYVARIDQEKQLMTEQVVQAGKLAALGEMASGMAHEINNPVGIMVQEAQWIETLLQKGEKSLAGSVDEIKDSLNEIRTHGTRCRDIILKLISFTRKDEPVVQALQLNELIEEIIGLCQQRAHSMKIELRLNLEPALPLVSVAASDVQQVLINLINNSLDAMERGGGAIEIRTSTKARYAVVDVMDSGPGISQENLGRVFEPFFSTKPEGKGTGLGLSICYSMMKKMKGDITVTSREGKGTTFHLFFPLQETELLD